MPFYALYPPFFDGEVLGKGYSKLLPVLLTSCFWYAIFFFFLYFSYAFFILMTLVFLPVVGLIIRDDWMILPSKLLLEFLSTLTATLSDSIVRLLAAYSIFLSVLSSKLFVRCCLFLSPFSLSYTSNICIFLFLSWDFDWLNVLYFWLHVNLLKASMTSFLRSFSVLYCCSFWNLPDFMASTGMRNYFTVWKQRIWDSRSLFVCKESQFGAF